MLILTSLADGARRYAFMTDVAGSAARDGVRTPRLGSAAGHSERRRRYQITAVGQAVLAEPLKSMQRIVRIGRRRIASA